MALLTITLGGTDRTSLCRSLDTEAVVNGTGRATFEVLDPAGSYAPAEYDEVLIDLGGTRIWSGTILRVEVTYLAAYAGLLTRVTAADRQQLADRVLRNGIDASGQTLKQLLTKLVNENLSAVGVTLHAGQVNGPTLGVQTWPWSTARQVLDYLAAITGYLWRIDASKVLAMWAVGDRSAGVTFSKANANVAGASWTREITSYRNTQWLIYGPAGTLDVAETFPGTGAARDFALNYLPVAEQPHAVTVNPGATVRPVGTYISGAPDPMFEWNYDPATSQLRQGGSYTPLSGSETATITYSALFPCSVYVTDSGEVTAHGTWMTVDTAQTITDRAAAVELANGLITTNKVRPQKVDLVTFTGGINPGETVTVSLSDLGLSGTYFVDTVRASYQPTQAGHKGTYTLSLSGGSYRQASALDWWRGLGGGGGGASTISVVSGGGGTTVLQGQSAPVWFGGGESVRTRVPTAGAWVRGFDGGEPVFDSTKMPALVFMDLLMLADAATGGNAQCRVIAGKDAWDDTTVVSGTITPVTDGSTWVWQLVTITLRAGIWAYRIEMTSSVNVSDVGFRAYLRW